MARDAGGRELRTPWDDHPREACGVFGVYAASGADVDVARAAYFGLCALQHRGQESAGIAVWDGARLKRHVGLGLVTQAFDAASLGALGAGVAAVGHTRYSTSGASDVAHAQPMVAELEAPHVLALAHNGNVVNADALRAGLPSPNPTNDTAAVVAMLAARARADVSAPLDGAPSLWARRLGDVCGALRGAFALVVLTEDGLYGVRDPWGFRPLCIGRLPGGRGVVLASESCALETVGARWEREVEPGELVRVSAGGVEAWRWAEAPGPEPALCVFEHVYFARPESRLGGRTVHRVRQALGEALAEAAPASVDVVLGVPDSATPAALGYARALGVPYDEGLTKNRYIGRTFIQPDDRMRRAGVRLKYNPIRANLDGRRVALVDDSLVRGHTMRALVRLMRAHGAREVHVRIASPPVRHPCFMGVDMPRHGELMAHRLGSPEAICAAIEADSLAFLPHDALLEAAGGEGHCSACFTGRYPLDVGALGGVGERGGRGDAGGG